MEEEEEEEVVVDDNCRLLHMSSMYLWPGALSAESDAKFT